ncbi:hypothetical protein AAVH_15702 [Aphelenchoides avenae]|nr:hypothetical protein AAVH_15702 [Aphelenchus avenae]
MSTSDSSASGATSDRKRAGALVLEDSDAHAETCILAVGARRRRAKSAKDNPGACQKPPKEDSGHEGGPEASLKKIAEVEICDGAFMWHNSTPASLLVRRLHGEPQKTYYSFAPLNGCMVEAMVMTGRDQFVGDLVRKLAKDKHISVHVDTLIVSVKTTVKEHTFEEMMMTVRVLADALKRVRRIAWADF